MSLLYLFAGDPDSKKRKKDVLKSYDAILKKVTGYNPDSMPVGNISTAYLRKDVSEEILKEFVEVTGMIYI